MKQKLLLSLLVLLAATTVWADVEINATNFPDEKFRNWVLKQSYGSDGVLTDAEIAGIYSINVSGKNIQSLNGIRFFTELRDLRCSNNKLRKLDVSGCPALTRLECQENQISSAAMELLVKSLPQVENGSIYVRYYSDEQNVMTVNQANAARRKGWTALEAEINGALITYHQYDGCESVDVEIDETNFPDEIFRNWLLAQPFGKDGVLTDEEVAYITEIDVSDMGISSLKGLEFLTVVEKLRCSNNQLTNLNCYKNTLRELDISGCTALTELTCKDTWLTALDVSGCMALTELTCEDTWLTALDVSGCTALTSLDCQNNQLTTLDVSGNAALTSLECGGNKLTSLNVSGCATLSSLGCGSNKLTSLNVSGNAALSSLNCRRNKLTSLDVSKNTAMIGLSCDNNPLATLDVTENAMLKYLYCSNNQLTSLDVTENVMLKYLYCNNNQLTSLDVTKNTELEFLYCTNNQLTTLDASGCTALRLLEFYQNQIHGEGMDALIDGLPEMPLYMECKLVAIAENDQNVMTMMQVEEATEKGWTVQSFWGGNYGGIDPNAKDVAINETNFPDENFRNWNLSQPYGADGILTPTESAYYSSIHVERQNIKDLTGIEYFPGLTHLFCCDNQLTTLDVSKFKKLTRLVCYNSQLTQLNVTGCQKLTWLECYNNQLTRLDVTGCQKLERLYCYQNQIKRKAMKELVESLPENINWKWLHVMYNENEGNVMTKPQAATARDKEWHPCIYNGTEWISFHGKELLSEEFFPDENFRSWILSQPYGADGELSEEELDEVTMIDVSGKNIRSLEGIDVFTELKTLKCNNNLLTELNLSWNTKLATLTCYSNHLTSLNVSGCNELTNLNTHSNNLKGEAMDALVEALPFVSNRRWYVIDNENANEQNVMTALQVENAKDKGWMPFWRNGGWQEYAGSDPDGIKQTPISPEGEQEVYNLVGQRLSKPQRGINIINGRKILK